MMVHFETRLLGRRVRLAIQSGHIARPAPMVQPPDSIIDRSAGGFWIHDGQQMPSWIHVLPRHAPYPDKSWVWIISAEFSPNESSLPMYWLALSESSTTVSLLARPKLLSKHLAEIGLYRHDVDQHRTIERRIMQLALRDCARRCPRLAQQKLAALSLPYSCSSERELASART